MWDAYRFSSAPVRRTAMRYRTTTTIGNIAAAAANGSSPHAKTGVPEVVECKEPEAKGLSKEV